MAERKTAAVWRQLQDAFLDLLERNPQARSHRLAQLRRQDLALHDEVLSMLEAHGEAGQLEIENHLLEACDSLIGRYLGVYRIEQEIGRGGMGTVYLAERTDGYEQQVALKIMRAGLGGAEMEARFRRERQILARLTHPNIAQLLDGGVSQDGRPYLVMQKIHGQPITRFCDTRALSVEARLALFCTVCEAVHYAHRNLVVHRDLKPSNILVTVLEGQPELSDMSGGGASADGTSGTSGTGGEEGQIKLLDFGIAKLLTVDDGDSEQAQEPGRETIRDDDPGPTHADLRLMTPEYAAPEQVRGEAVTTATDTYALGVLLYELLAGERPFARTGDGRGELEERICSRSHTPPSEIIKRQLEKDPESAAHLAAARATSAPRLRRQLAGDLDTIVARALAKEPERRYGSAEQLGEDIRRHLDGEPVKARPDSLGYRLGRFWVRHTWEVTAGLGGVALLLVFSLMTILQSKALARERDEARLQRQSAEQVTDVLIELFELTDPTKTPDGRLLAVDELLERHSTRVIGRLATQPEVQARLRHILGRVHRAHSQFDRSRQLLEAARDQRRELAGAQDEQLLAIEHDLAVLEARTGSRPKAEAQLRASLARHRALLGDEHESVAQGMQDLAMILAPGMQERTRLLEQALELRQRLEIKPGLNTASSLNDLAIERINQRRFDEAIDLLSRSLALVEESLGEDHPFALTVKGNLASIYTGNGNPEKAVELERELLAQKRSIFGEQSVIVANALNNLGATLASLGDLEGAEQVLADAMQLWQRLVGAERLETVNSARSLARVIELRGRPAEAWELLQRIASFEIDTEPFEEPFFATQAAALEMRLGRPALAAKTLEEILSELKASLPKDDDRIVDAQLALAEARLQLGEQDAAAELYERALKSRRTTRDPSNPLIAEAACGLARTQVARHELEQARRLFDGCLDAYARWGLAHPETLEATRQAALELAQRVEAESPN